MSLSISLIPQNITKRSSDSTFIGIVIESKENYFLFGSGIAKYYVYEKENDQEVGDWLKINGSINPINMTTYESQFSFLDYLKQKGVEYQISYKSIEKKLRVPLRTKKIRQNFLSKFDEQTGGLIDALLFCNKNYENVVVKTADKLDLIFLLSMSGIYLNFLLLSLEKLLEKFLTEKWSHTISIITVIPYCVFIFPRVGVVRVITTKIFKLVNENWFKKKLSSLTITSLVGIAFLFIDFHLAYQQAFLIGFGLSLALNFSRCAISNFKKKYQKVLILVWLHLLMLPVVIQNSNSLHLFLLIFQILLIPFNEIFVVISLLSFYINLPSTNLLSFLSNLLEKVYVFLLKLDISIPIGKAFYFLIPLFYIGLFTVLYLVESKRYFHLKFGVLPSAISLIIGIVPFSRIMLNAVYFINVGQGDSLIIQNKNKVVMIDTGGVKNIDLASETLIPFMKKNHINHIDALITTHNDSDHNGAAASLITNFPVYNYLTNKEDFPYQIGDIYLKNINTYNSSEDNDNSLVFNVDFMGKKWLLMGDASTTVEKFLIDANIDIDCDILKVGHHGSKTSTSEEFIKACSPEEAIISVGAKNYYGHPNQEVIDLLAKYNVTIRRTDIEGTISYTKISF